MEHPAVLECAITAVPDDLRGQIVKATIVLTKNYQPSDELIKELQNHVKKVTAPYKYPRIVEFVKELPKNDVGQKSAVWKSAKTTKNSNIRSGISQTKNSAVAEFFNAVFVRFMCGFFCFFALFCVVTFCCRGRLCAFSLPLC
ncbi:MAG: hypothetical protein L6V85_04490 [Clostridiales bacterium]|nr:MAG: hypothetical protein L6V85_04490 [Clostridiales bacterium]